MYAYVFTHKYLRARSLREYVRSFLRFAFIRAGNFFCELAALNRISCSISLNVITWQSFSIIPVGFRCIFPKAHSMFNARMCEYV